MLGAAALDSRKIHQRIVIDKQFVKIDVESVGKVFVAAIVCIFDCIAAFAYAEFDEECAYYSRNLFYFTLDVVRPLHFKKECST